MIYSNEFVWLHFPRCAGTKIEQIFREYYSSNEQIFQDVVDATIDPDISWHDSIAERKARDQQFELDMRMVICSFRRLPAWLESRYSFEVNRNPQLIHRPERLLIGRFLEASGVESYADWYVQKYLPEEFLNLERVRFIRTEYFEKDFKAVFEDYVDLSVVPEWEYEKKANASVSVVPNEIRTEMYGNQEVYRNCPYWKMVEEFAYG